MESWTGGGAREQSARAADSGADASEDWSDRCLSRGSRYQSAPVSAPSYPPSSSTTTGAAGSETGTITRNTDSRLNVPLSSDPSESAGVRPVPPSWPRPPVGANWPLLSYFAYGPLRDTVPTARARTKAVLAEWDITPGDLLLGDIAVVVSELVSNAVMASRALPGSAEVRMWLCCDGVRLLVEVGDHSPDRPMFVPPSDEALSGRGLHVVAGLSNGGWGWFPATTHGLAKVVWAETHLPPTTVEGSITGQSRLCRSSP